MSIIFRGKTAVLILATTRAKSQRLASQGTLTRCSSLEAAPPRSAVPNPKTQQRWASQGMRSAFRTESAPSRMQLLMSSAWAPTLDESGHERTDKRRLSRHGGHARGRARAASARAHAQTRRCSDVQVWCSQFSRVRVAKVRGEGLESQSVCLCYVEILMTVPFKVQVPWGREQFSRLILWQLTVRPFP